MPKPMTKYRKFGTELTKVELHSFKPIRGGDSAYCERGNLKTYANITQCERKVRELQSLGYNCYRTWKWPFLILLNNEQ